MIPGATTALARRSPVGGRGGAAKVVAVANLARILVGTRADVPREKAVVAVAQASMTFAQ